MAVDITLTVDEARTKRHEAGIRKYRQDPNGPYVGDPLMHLYEELLDALNYAEECGKQALLSSFRQRELRLGLWGYAATIRDLLKERRQA